MRRFTLVLFGLTLLFATLLARENFGVQPVQRLFNCWDRAWDVAVQGDYAYVATAVSGLQIVDISDPEQLKVTGFYDTFGRTFGIDVSGDYVYLAEAEGGLVILNIADPQIPFLVTQIEYPGAIRVTVRDSLLYVAANDFFIVDVSDPTEPLELGSFSRYGVTEFSVSEQYIFCTNGGLGSRGDRIFVLDASDPTNIQRVIRNLHVRGCDGAIAVNGEHLYFGLFEGLSVFDISDPADHIEIGRLDSLKSYDIAIRGNVAFIVGRRLGFGFGIFTVDISDPTNPFLISSLGGESCYSIKIVNNLAIASSYREGIAVADFSDLENPRWTDSYTTEEFVYGVKLDGNLLIVDQTRHYYLFDISNLNEPVVEYCGRFNSEVLDVEIKDQFAYFGLWGGGLRIVDITNHNNPLEVGHFEWGASHVEIRQDVAYVSSGHILGAVDISDNTNPRALGHYDLPGRYPEWDIRDIAIQDDYLYLANKAGLGERGSGLRVLDISDPNNLIEISYLSVGRPEALDVFGDLVCLTTPDGFCTVDITDPFNPELCVRFESLSRRCEAVSIEWDYAYVADEDSGLFVIDISDWRDPQVVGYYDTPGIPNDVAVNNGIVFVADYTNLGIYDCTEVVNISSKDQQSPESFSISAPYPNPFNSLTTFTMDLPTVSDVTSNIYDLSGRKIATIIDDQLLPGRHRLSWDAEEAPAGLYFCRINAGENLVIRKMLLVR
ncbi:MAG: T9SS type A sorting domain-containing protein [Calditrichaeota bacterium]|jgi:hypothetical protein|nr:T9SS type A sorting domain-containing protein [Calditrichota bacterium]MBT7789626.1 T9SS type A sorting domain-containing protein [Calditrichota bacterium]